MRRSSWTTLNPALPNCRIGWRIRSLSVRQAREMHQSSPWWCPRGSHPMSSMTSADWLPACSPSVYSLCISHRSSEQLTVSSPRKRAKLRKVWGWWAYVIPRTGSHGSHTSWSSTLPCRPLCGPFYTRKWWARHRAGSSTQWSGSMASLSSASSLSHRACLQRLGLLLSWRH